MKSTTAGAGGDVLTVGVMASQLCSGPMAFVKVVQSPGLVKESRGDLRDTGLVYPICAGRAAELQSASSEVQGCSAGDRVLISRSVWCSVQGR